jgi:hypothetical protein
VLWYCAGYMNNDLVGLMASLIPTPRCHFLQVRLVLSLRHPHHAGIQHHVVARSASSQQYGEQLHAWLQACAKHSNSV